MPGLAACHGRQRAVEQHDHQQRPPAVVAKGKAHPRMLSHLRADDASGRFRYENRKEEPRRLEDKSVELSDERSAQT